MSGPRSADPDLPAEVERSLRHRFGVEPARASVTFVGVEPIDVLRFETDPGSRTYVSIGMSRQPMTGADAPALAADGPRAELLLEVRRGGDDDVWRGLALLAAAPAVEGVVYREDMTIDLSGPLVAGSRCTGALVEGSGLAPVVADGVEVRILRLVPVTAGELAWCRVRGAPALRELWEAQRVDLLDLRRPPAQLR